MAAIYYSKLREVIKDNDYLFINTFATLWNTDLIRSFGILSFTRVAFGFALQN